MAIRLVAEVPCLLHSWIFRSFFFKINLPSIIYQSKYPPQYLLGVIGEYFRNFLGLRPSLGHVALHTGHNLWKEYILRFLKTPPFKNLKAIEW